MLDAWWTTWTYLFLWLIVKQYWLNRLNGILIMRRSLTHDSLLKTYRDFPCCGHNIVTAERPAGNCIDAIRPNRKVTSGGLSFLQLYWNQGKIPNTHSSTFCLCLTQAVTGSTVGLRRLSIYPLNTWYVRLFSQKSVPGLSSLNTFHRKRLDLDLICLWK